MASQSQSKGSQIRKGLETLPHGDSVGTDSTAVNVTLSKREENEIKLEQKHPRYESEH